MSDETKTTQENQENQPADTPTGTRAGTRTGPSTGAPAGAPAGTKSAAALFDLDPKEEKKEEKKDEKKPSAKPAAKPAAKGAASGASKASANQKNVEPKKYPSGTEVRYQGHSLTLEKEMTAKEVLEWISEDDFPELAYEQVELRHDEKKNRLVPVCQAQKKGLAGALRIDSASGRIPRS